jgi:hypothetical protein
MLDKGRTSMHGAVSSSWKQYTIPFLMSSEASQKIGINLLASNPLSKTR